MATQKRSLIFSVYSPALDGDAVRTLAIIQAMERVLPGLSLGWTISDEGKFIPLPRRNAWVAEAAARKELPMLTNGNEHSLVTVSGWERPAGISSGGRPQFEVHAYVPFNEAGIAAAVDVLEGVAEGARAFWGRVLPEGAGTVIAQQVRHSRDVPHVPSLGLPALGLPEDIRSPEVPHHLGWVNYWSAATARMLGFPDPTRDVDLLSRARRTGTGGWVVQLTETPLDLDAPAHLDALLRAYERFPEIGGRSAPPGRR